MEKSDWLVCPDTLDWKVQRVKLDLMDFQLVIAEFDWSEIFKLQVYFSREFLDVMEQTEEMDWMEHQVCIAYNSSSSRKFHV